MSGGKPKITSSDRETARQLVEALVVTRRVANVEEVARILAFLREQILSCARVDAERERAREAAGHAAWCRTDGCDGSCREPDDGTSEAWRQLEAERKRLKESLALLVDAACYPNKDISELEIYAARDVIASALGFVIVKKRWKRKEG